MLAKESVKARMTSEEGMSFTEFSYQLLQGYDFLHLYNQHGVELELGGSDQWGNITAGIELVRKKQGEQVFGATFPLLTRSDGQKFGKSEKGAVWLAPEKTSPYDFYQYFYRIPDADVIKTMCLLTFIDIREIRAYEEALKSNTTPPNTVQKRLAEEVTRIVHGEEGLKYAQTVTQNLNPGAQSNLDNASLQVLEGKIPTHSIAESSLIGVKLIDVIATLGILSSKGEARKLIKNNGLYLNNQSIKDENYILQPTDLIERKILIGIGKKHKELLCLI
jgi:tyrosyl-tRNA synthetase